MNQVVTCELQLLMTHCLLENTYTGTHSPQGSTDNQGTLSNLCSVRTSKQHELQPCTQASRCRTRDGGRPRGNGHPPEFTHTKCKRMRGSQPLMGERRHLACCLLKFGSPSNIKINRPRRNTERLKAIEARGQGSLVNSLGNEFHMRFGRGGEIVETF